MDENELRKKLARWIKEGSVEAAKLGYTLHPLCKSGYYFMADYIMERMAINLPLILKHFQHTGKEKAEIKELKAKISTLEWENKSRGILNDSYQKLVETYQGITKRLTEKIERLLPEEGKDNE
jgi:hypothetical protein